MTNIISESAGGASEKWQWSISTWASFSALESYLDQYLKHVLGRMFKAVIHVNIHWTLVVNMS